MSHTSAAAAPLCPDCGRWMSPIRLEGPSLWFCPDCQGDEPDGDYLERLAAPSRPMPLRPGAIARVNAPAAAAATGEPGEQTG